VTIPIHFAVTGQCWEIEDLLHAAFLARFDSATTTDGPLAEEHRRLVESGATAARFICQDLATYGWTFRAELYVEATDGHRNVNGTFPDAVQVRVSIIEPRDA
jgi:hypothetical protein